MKTLKKIRSFAYIAAALTLSLCLNPSALMAQEEAEIPKVDVIFPVDLMSAVDTLIGLVVSVIVIGLAFSFGMTGLKASVAYLRGALRKGNGAS